MIDDTIIGSEDGGPRGANIAELKEVVGGSTSFSILVEGTFTGNDTEILSKGEYNELVPCVRDVMVVTITLGTMIGPLGVRSTLVDVIELLILKFPEIPSSVGMIGWAIVVGTEMVLTAVEKLGTCAREADIALWVNALDRLAIN